MGIRPIDACRLMQDLKNYLDMETLAEDTRSDFGEGIDLAMGEVAQQPTLSLNTLRDEIYQDAVAHGLWDWAMAYKHQPDLRDSCMELILGEVYELEIECGDEECYAEELADIIIVSMSVAGKLGIDIDAAIRRKMEINKGRPWKHGKE